MLRRVARGCAKLDRVRSIVDQKYLSHVNHKAEMAFCYSGRVWLASGVNSG